MRLTHVFLHLPLVNRIHVTCRLHHPCEAIREAPSGWQQCPGSNTHLPVLPQFFASARRHGSAAKRIVSTVWWVCGKSSAQLEIGWRMLEVEPGRTGQRETIEACGIKHRQGATPQETTGEILEAAFLACTLFQFHSSAQPTPGRPGQFMLRSDMLARLQRPQTNTVYRYCHDRRAELLGPRGWLQNGVSSKKMYVPTSESSRGTRPACK